MDVPSKGEIIQLAWCDRTSFNMIRRQTGLTEREVIRIMRAELKPKAFKVWRTRIKGRHAKSGAYSRKVAAYS